MTSHQVFCHACRKWWDIFKDLADLSKTRCPACDKLMWEAEALKLRDEKARRRDNTVTMLTSVEWKP